MQKIKIFACLIFLLSYFSVEAKLKVLTTVPDLAWLAQELGKELVEAESLLTGAEDPHFVDAIPPFVLKASKADILCFVGLELEIGWLPKVQENSGNSEIQMGGKGWCNASLQIKRKQVFNIPVNRAMGDIHPLGNPHYTLSPLDMMVAAKTIVSVLIASDTQNAEKYIINQVLLEEKLKALHKEITDKYDAAFGKGKRPLVVEYHREYIYYFDSFGFKSFGTIERVPGIPPSAGRLAEIGIRSKLAKVKLGLAMTYHPRGKVERFKEISGIPVAILYGFIQTRPGSTVTDYPKFQHHLADTIIETAAKNP